MLTCKTRGQTAGIPAVAEPAVAPDPPVAIAIQVEHATVAVRVAQNEAKEAHPRNLAIPPEPFETAVLLVLLVILPQCQKDVSAELGVSRGLQAFELLLAVDRAFALLEPRLEYGRGEINFSERERAFIEVLFALEAVAVSRTFPDCPTGTDELGRVEFQVGIDTDNPGFADDESATIVEEGGEAFAGTLWIAHHIVLKPCAIEVDLTAIGIRNERRYD